MAEVCAVILRYFYILLTAELFLGGGGRLLEVGPVTVRMLLFSVALGVLLLPQFWRRLGDDVIVAVGIVVVFFAVHIPALIIGLVHGADVNVVFGEIQPLLYWLIAPFFAQILNQERYITLTSDTVRVAGLVLATAYLVVLVGLLVGYLDFSSTYELLGATGEFMFRGDQGLFVYKGFLYLCIALVFFISIRSSARYLSILLISSAIVLTLTRGFMLSTAVAGFLLMWTKGKRKTSDFIVPVCVAVTSIVLIVFLLPDGSIFYRKDVGISDATRYDDINYMLTNVNAFTLVFGHGFGSVISGSRLSIENTYLWIWWKCGIAGLLFWLMPLALCAAAYKRIPIGSKNFSLGSAYFFSVVLIYLQTATNPYLTNPIGLSFVIIAIFSLRKIARTELVAKFAVLNSISISQSGLA